MNQVSNTTGNRNSRNNVRKLIEEALQGGLSTLLKSSWFYAHAYNPSTVRLVLLSRGWYLATITCVKLSVGPITHVESYGQVHKSWRTGSCLPFGNCNCYYLYLVKCLFLFLFVCSVVALVLSLFCPGYPV